MELMFKLERSGPNGEKLSDACLYLGNQTDGDNFSGQRLCVLESPNCRSVTERYRHIAILEHRANGVCASRAKLDEAAEYITEMLQGGEDLLVHCGAGIERSPLTVAWWFVHVHAFANLDTAYAVMKQVRPVIEDRQAWLEPLQ